MKLHAWIGKSETGHVEIKKAVDPTGKKRELVAIDGRKRTQIPIDTPEIRQQLQKEADRTGQTIRLAEFTLTASPLANVKPQGKKGLL